MQPAANHNLIVSLSHSAAINIVVTGEPHCAAAGRAANVLMALVPSRPYAQDGTPNELACRTRRCIPVITRAAPQLRSSFLDKAHSGGEVGLSPRRFGSTHTAHSRCAVESVYVSVALSLVGLPHIVKICFNIFSSLLLALLQVSWL